MWFRHTKRIKNKKKSKKRRNETNKTMWDIYWIFKMMLLLCVFSLFILFNRLMLCLSVVIFRPLPHSLGLIQHKLLSILFHLYTKNIFILSLIFITYMCFDFRLFSVLLRKSQFNFTDRYVIYYAISFDFAFAWCLCCALNCSALLFPFCNAFIAFSFEFKLFWNRWFVHNYWV